MIKKWNRYLLVHLLRMKSYLNIEDEQKLIWIVINDPIEE